MNQLQENLPTPQNAALIEVQKSRETQEVQGAIISAKRFPRDTNQAYMRIIESCKRISLAQVSTYSYPRGKETISGPSIRLAEVLAQNYGNIDFGVQELERRDGVSIARSYCWDIENNVRQTKVFEVPHSVYTKREGLKHLTDPRDIYEHVANLGARRLRACILGIIPGDIVEAAVTQCKKTLAAGDGKPIADRIREMVVAFKSLGVSQEMIEGRVNHKIDLTTGDELVELISIHNAIRDKQAKRGDFFDFPDDEETKVATEQPAKAKDLTELLKQKSAVRA